jgi:hypothetical protein
VNHHVHVLKTIGRAGKIKTCERSFAVRNPDIKVADQPHDRIPLARPVGIAGAHEANLLANGISSLQDVVDEPLIDNGRARGGFGVGGVEGAS